MKFQAIVFAVTFAIGPVLVGQAAPLQDLDRISDIVNQARGMAETARTGNLSATTNESDSDAVGRSLNNPFSRTNSVANLRQESDRPNVDVGQNAIQIDAGGRQFTIPRVGSVDGGNINQNLAASIGNAVGGTAPRGRANVGAALKTANAYRIFGDATRLFYHADYQGSWEKLQTIEDVDPLSPIEQFQSLCLFANGEYAKSAEIAYASIAQMPFYSWEQLRAFYGDSEDYVNQYRQLQVAVSQHQSDATLRFLLGYHHLMLGHRQHAAREFEFVLTKLPGDQVVNQLLSISKQAPPAPIN